MSEDTKNPKTARAVLIGNELLSGKVQDLNGALLIKELRALGVRLEGVEMILDGVEHIAEAVARASAAAGVVFTSGGLGPTHDDITLEGVARAFSMPMHTDEQIAAIIEETFEDRGGIEAWMRMAYVPVECEMVYTEQSRWPIYKVRNVYLLPGIPGNFRRQLQALRPRLRVGTFALHTLFTNLHEGLLAATLTQADARFETVEIGSYPVRNQDYTVRVTIESRDGDAAQAATKWLQTQLGDDAIVRVEEGA